MLRCNCKLVISMRFETGTGNIIFVTNQFVIEDKFDAEVNNSPPPLPLFKKALSLNFDLVYFNNSVQNKILWKRIEVHEESYNLVKMVLINGWAPNSAFQYIFFLKANLSKW